MLDAISFSKAQSIEDASVSGWKSVSLDDKTGVVTAISNDGTTFTYKYPLPKDGRGIKNARTEERDNELYLILELED